MRHASLLALVAAVLSVTACSPETSRPEASGKGTVRGINAIATSPQIVFLVEERSAGVLSYRNATESREWDDLEYTFNFETVLAGADERTRIASQFIDVVADTDYVLAVSGELANPTVTVWEAPRPEFADSDTGFEVRFGHLAAMEGSVDVFFAAPEVLPAAGQEIGTLAYGEALAPRRFESGEYVLTYTTAGNPADILFQSNAVQPADRAAWILAVFDKDANDVAPLAVQLINTSGSTSVIPDVDSPPIVQFIQASTALATADVFIEDEADLLTVPDIEMHSFGDIAPSVPVSIGSNFITYTTPMDTMSILFNSEALFFGGTRNRYVMVGDTDNLRALEIRPDLRSIETVGRLSILHTALNHPSVNIYVIEQGVELSDSLPLYLGVAPGIVPLSNDLRLGDFELYVTSPDEDRTVIAGPYELNVAGGEVFGLLVLDNVSDPSIADIVAIPSP